MPDGGKSAIDAIGQNAPAGGRLIIPLPDAAVTCGTFPAVAPVKSVAPGRLAERV